MIGKILGVLLLIIMGIFTICSCMVSAWAEREMEEDLRRREGNEKKKV